MNSALTTDLGSIDDIVDDIFWRAHCPRVPARHPKAKRPRWPVWADAIQAALRARGAPQELVDDFITAVFGLAQCPRVPRTHPDAAYPRWPVWERAIRRALRHIAGSSDEPGADSE